MKWGRVVLNGKFCRVYAPWVMGWLFANRGRERGDKGECVVNINRGKMVMMWKRQRAALDQK